MRRILTTVPMGPRKQKLLIAITCTAGVCGVAYGIAEENDPVFVLGLLFVIGGYLVVRKKLKASLPKDSRREEHTRNGIGGS